MLVPFLAEASKIPGLVQHTFGTFLAVRAACPCEHEKCANTLSVAPDLSRSLLWPSQPHCMPRCYTA